MNMSTKYMVAPRRMVSKRLGMPGNLIVGLLALMAMITNATTSTMTRCGDCQGSCDRIRLECDW